MENHPCSEDAGRFRRVQGIAGRNGDGTTEDTEGTERRQKEKRLKHRGHGEEK